MRPLTSARVPADDTATVYPCLKRSRLSDCIVLFSSPRCGVVVSESPSGGHPLIGTYREDWAEPGVFVPFRGSVLLTPAVNLKGACAQDEQT